MRKQIVEEHYGGELYVYRPLGTYVVSAPGVCAGRPTFKYTRIEAAGALNLAAAGVGLDNIARRYSVPPEAVQEAIRLAGVELNGLQRAA